MAISFPSTPSANQTFTVGNKSWIWNGYAWDLVVQNLSPIYNQANNSYIYASSTANNAYNTANAAWAAANASYTYASSTANNAYNTANAAWAGANASYTYASSTANNSYITANNAWAKANAANTIASSAYNNANSAYNAANNKLDLGGGTVTGPVTISSSLTVTGNVTFSGNVTTVSANNLSVKDNMIYLNNGSNVANPDLGFAGNYNDGIYHHAGFFRDATDGIWKIFDNYEPEPDLSPWIDTSNNTFRIANFQANTITANVINIASSSLIANLNSDFLDGQHGSYYTNLSIAAFGNANLAFDRANTAYAQANASYTYASSTANNAYNTANNSYNTANLAFDRANTAYAQANSSYTYASSTANNAYATANVAWAAANTANTYANSTYLKLSGGTLTGNVYSNSTLTIGGSNTSHLINLDSPSNQLQVNGTHVRARLNRANTSGTTAFDFQTNGFWDWAFGTTGSGASANTLFYRSSSGGGLDVIAMDYNGNVGIGNTSPQAKLSIFDNSANDAVRITQTGSGNALVVEDSTSPDSTPFVIDNNGGIGIGTSAVVGYTIRSVKPITGSASSYGFQTFGTIQSDVTNSARIFDSIPSTQGTSFNIPTLEHFSARFNLLGAGSSITNQMGFSANSSLVAATNNYGFYGDLPASTGHWNFYAAGTADNYFAGNVGIGINTPSYKLDVSGSANVSSLYIKASLVDPLAIAPAYNTANVAWAAANTKASITGYTANSIIFANSSGYISNSSSLSFYSSNNNIVTSGLVVNRLILANDNIIIGNLAGATSPGSGTIAIGSQAGYLNQRNYSIALGFYAGGSSQGPSSVAIGPSAGYDTQASQSVAIGSGTASYGQGNNAVAIGTSAGNLSQGNNAIAIGNQAGYNGQIANSIILNSSDSALNATTYSGLYINPIRYNTSSIANLIFYDISTKELTYAPVSLITSNTAYNTANAAYSVANTAWAGANASYIYASSTANNAYNTANAAWAGANASYTYASSTANAAYSVANTAWAGANASYTYASSTANNAYITANNAWAKANAAAATSNVSSNLVTTNVTTGTYYPFLSPSVSGNNAVYANNTLSYNVSNGSLSANNLLLQNDGTNAYIRPTNFNSALYLGANNANILALGKTSTTAYGTLSDTDVGVNFYIQNKDSTSARYPGLIIENYAGSLSAGMSVIELKRARGTSISPTSVVLGDLLGGFNTWGQNGSGFQSATRIQGYAANTFSTAISAGLQFFTTLAGSQTEAVRIDENGRVGIGSTSPSNWYALSPQLLVAKSQDAETMLGIGNPTVGASAQAGIRIIGGTASSYVITRLNDNNGSPYFINDVGSGVNYIAWSVGGSEKMRLNSSTGNLGIGTSTPSYKLQVNGSFAATTKSFVIDHPTKEGMQLRYGSLEGPENGVYVRGKLKNTNVIELPDYWTKLIDEDSITVNLTPIGNHQNLFVEKIEDNKVYIKNSNILYKEINCFYTIFAERIDVDKLIVEI